MKKRSRAGTAAENPLFPLVVQAALGVEIEDVTTVAAYSVDSPTQATVSGVWYAATIASLVDAEADL